MSTNNFAYQPLLEPDAFRVLHLQPSLDRSALIYCELEHTTLSKYDHDLIDPYTALSYVWGDASDTLIIQVDGQPFPVTKNLHDTLECLRDEKRVFSVWADAICIDQSNIPERNAQVTQMGRIYSCATHTTIFLSPFSHDLDFVLRETESWAQDRPELSVEKTRDIWSRFASLLSEPWFYRVWILQELVLSRDPFVQCGRRRIRWDLFCSIGSLLEGAKKEASPVIYSSSWSDDDDSPSESIDDKTLLAGEIDKDLTVLKQMSGIRNIYIKNSWAFLKVDGNKLYDIVGARRGYGASDPRDIIYAQAGLVSSELKGSKSVFEIDYMKSPSKVFAEGTHHMLREGTKIFDFLDRRDRTTNPLLLPSWVPDWSVTWTPILKRVGGWGNAGETAKLATQRSTLVSLQGDKNVLLIEVQYCATISQVGGLAKEVNDLVEEISFTDYFAPELPPDDVETVIDNPDWKRGSLDLGIKRLLHGWLTALGLPDVHQFPQNDVPKFISTLPHWELQKKAILPYRRLHDNPYMLLARYYGFVASDDEGGKYSTLKRPTTRPLESDRICTIEGEAALPFDEGQAQHTVYDIIAAPGNSQIGDVVVAIDTGNDGDGTTLLVLRRLDLPEEASEELLRHLPSPEGDSEELLAVVEVIGTVFVTKSLNCMRTLHAQHYKTVALV